MLQEAKKFVTRKIKKLEYKNINLPEGYETTENEYKQIRDNIDSLKSIYSITKLNELVSKKGVIKKNNASRKKARLSKITK